MVVVCDRGSRWCWFVIEGRDGVGLWWRIEMVVVCDRE